MRRVVEPNGLLQQASWCKSLNPPEKPLSPQGWKAIEDWISLNSSAWSQVESAVAQKHCHRIYQRASGLPLWYSWDNPPMAKLRRLVQLGLWASRLAMEQEHIDDAVDVCLTLLLVGAHWQKNALLIDQLMAQSLSQAICREITRIVETTHLSGSQLSDLETRLLQAYRDGYPHMSFDGERLIALDLIQYCFTRGGPGGGHVVTMDYFADLHKTIGFPNTDASAPFDMMASSVNAALTMMHASRDRQSSTSCRSTIVSAPLPGFRLMSSGSAGFAIGAIEWGLSRCADTGWSTTCFRPSDGHRRYHSAQGQSMRPL